MGAISGAWVSSTKQAEGSCAEQGLVLPLHVQCQMRWQQCADKKQKLTLLGERRLLTPVIPD